MNESRPFIFKHALLLFLLLMLGLNLARFIRYAPQSNEPLDFRQLYAGAQLMDLGFNPYNDSLLKIQWNKNFTPEKLRGLAAPGAPENYLVYPPPFIASMIPFSRLPWDTARYWIWGLSGIWLLLIIYLLAKFQARSNLFLLLLFILSFKGSYIALVLGQPLLWSLFFILLHFLAERQNLHLFSGVFLALAMVKPSIALPVVLYNLGEWRIKSLLYTFLFSSAVMAILWFAPGIVPFWELYGGWLHNMQEQTAIPFAPGHDFLRHNLSSLSALLYSIGGPNLSMTDLPVLFVSSITILLLRYKNHITSLQSLTLLITCSFLFSYHLYYDLLLYSCILTQTELRRISLKSFWPLLLLYLPWGFLIPGFHIHPILLLIFLLHYVISMLASQGLTLKGE